MEHKCPSAVPCSMPGRKEFEPLFLFNAQPRVHDGGSCSPELYNTAVAIGKRSHHTWSQPFGDSMGRTISHLVGPVCSPRLEGKTGWSSTAILTGQQGRQWDEASVVMPKQRPVLTVCPSNVNVNVEPDKLFQSLLNQKEAPFRFCWACWLPL